jgi:hypothetical protein
MASTRTTASSSPHDRALAELALDLRERAGQGSIAGLRRLFLFLVRHGGHQSLLEVLDR